MSIKRPSAFWIQGCCDRRCRPSTTRGRPVGCWGNWEDRTQIQPRARLQTCALGCELCLQEGTSFSANSLKGDLCSFSLTTSKSLGCKGQELAPLSSSHKSASVSCCRSASSLPRAQTLVTRPSPSTPHPPAATAPEQPSSCEDSTPPLRLSSCCSAPGQAIPPRPDAGSKAGCQPFPTLVLAISTPGGTPPSLGPLSQVTLMSLTRGHTLEPTCREAM